jgi:hypothetical protein
MPLEEKRVKGIETSMVSIFVPYCSGKKTKSLQTLSSFLQKKYICFIYKGEKSLPHQESPTTTPLGSSLWPCKPYWLL